MRNIWTFGRKVGVGFAVIVSLALIMSLVSIYALRSVVASKDQVIAGTAQTLMEAQHLQTELEAQGSAIRGYLLVRDESLLARVRQARTDFTATLARVRGRPISVDGRALLGRVDTTYAQYAAMTDRVMALRRGNGSAGVIAHTFDTDILPVRESLDGFVRTFVEREQQVLEQERQRSSATATSAISLVLVLAVVVVALAVGVALVLIRSLSRQIGGAVGQVQSSAAELQTAATQQTTGSREQVTAMSEITTTISELLATSKQIADSAQRVAAIAGDTARGAKTGTDTIDGAHQSIGTIRRHTDLVVGHMLDLGKKSQQIGAILEIVSELAEQTNILSINATIEAAGAGEAGKRFAVVADEIRKLADRVAGSTKEIRDLIEDVRGAVNTTVMAAETGAKAVDAGSRQFGDVASAFKEIAHLVTTTTEAAREIELSTKQQATAVEQVNVAIADVAQATRETEVSSSQTLQTASQLVGLSHDLLRLIRPQTVG